MGIFKKSAEAERKHSRKRRLPLKKIIVILVLVLILGGTLYGGFRFLQKKEMLTVKSFDHVQMKPEVIAFTFDQLPEVYNALLKLNNEILLIDREIERLDNIEKEFPDQKKIVQSEKKIWQQAREKLQAALIKSDGDIEALYVAWQVNREKGFEKIQADQQNLASAMTDLLASAAPLTKRLKQSSPEKKLLDQVKEKFFNIRDQFLN